jgi:hypothetical protein
MGWIFFIEKSVQIKEIFEGSNGINVLTKKNSKLYMTFLFENMLNYDKCSYW